MLPVGVQLYSLRDYCAKDYYGTLKRVADIGYKLVEPPSFFNVRPSELKKMIDDLGLRMISTHSVWARSKANLGECMDLADILGLKRIVCGYTADDFLTMDAIKRTADNTNEMQEILERNGFMLYQHNHNYEFQRYFGKIKYQIYRELCPKVKYVLDCFWANNMSAEDPVEMVKLFADDTILLHIKDGDSYPRPQPPITFPYPVYERYTELVPLGKGKQPIKEIIANASPSTEAVIVELDFCNEEMFSAIEQSYSYLTENGLAAGNK